ncbi:MAG: FG-GAP repeat domain-containing protein, partial [Phycisphaerae bacterium]
MQIRKAVGIVLLGCGITSAAAAGDCNNNSIPDAQDIQGDPTFSHALSYLTGALPNAFDVGDLNADGYPDVVTNSLFDNMIVVLLNNGDGTYALPVSYAAGMRPVSLAVGDTNRDGYDDVVVADQNGDEILFFESDASGVLALADTMPFDAPVLVLLENLTSDAHRDLVF